MSFKKEIRLADAEEVALDFLSKTKGLYKRCLLAGSIRRREQIVHDVDFAVIPKGRNFGVWKEKVTRRVVSIGGRVTYFGETISNYIYNGVQLNLFLCLDDDASAVTQMWATGPKGHTIGMTIKARSRGLIINSRGLWTRDNPPRLVRARTEDDVGQLLGWKYKPPEARGKGGGKNERYEL